MVEQNVSTFLEYYITHAESPHDHPVFEYVLRKTSAETSQYRFGFLSKQILERELGLSNSLYKSQFESLFQRSEFSIKVFLVQSTVTSDTEVLFHTRNATLLDQAHTVSEFSLL